MIGFSGELYCKWGEERNELRDFEGWVLIDEGDVNVIKFFSKNS